MDPISKKERLVLLDVLRGIAILGMFTVNMTVDLPWGWRGWTTFREMDWAWGDFITLGVVDFLGSGKFLSMFSILFGIGFFIQADRAKARGGAFEYFYLRRSLGLFAIAWVGIFCGLMVDILTIYAVFGLTLLLFNHRSPRFILCSALVCFAASIIYEDVQSSLEKSETEISASPVMESVDNGDNVYREGSVFDIGSARATQNWTQYYSWQGWLLFDMVGLLLVGLYIGRSGAVGNLHVRKAMARSAMPWLMGIGLTTCLLSLVLLHKGGPSSTLTRKIVDTLTSWPISEPVLCLGYMSLVVLLFEHQWWRRILSPFAAVGQTALTNYIVINVVLAVICYPWGFGLYGDLLPTQGLLVVAVVFPLQVVFSRWWLSRFAFGPAEWVWRSLTYLQLQPLRLAEVQSGKK